jgi:hypothetical protein
LERKGEDEGEVWRITSLRFDNPTDAVQEHGTYWGTKAKPLSVGALAALLCLGADRIKKTRTVTHITSERATKGYGVVGRTGAFRQLAPQFGTPRNACPKPASLGEKAKPPVIATPGGFAVCAFAATLAR